MLLAESAATDEMIERFSSRRSTPPRGGSSGDEAAALLDLFELLREDVRLGAATLGRELKRMATEATMLEHTIDTLDAAGHALAVQAAAQAAALPRLGMLRRLLDRQLTALAGLAETAAGPGADAAARGRSVEEAKALGASLAQGLNELGAVMSPSDAYTEALSRVIGASAVRRGAEGSLKTGIEASRRRLERFEARLLLALRPPGAAERRREVRLPVRLAAVLHCGDRRWRGETVDLARGGTLVALEASFDRPPVGGSVRLELADLGPFPARIVGLSAKGVHLAFDDPTPAQCAVLEGRLAALAALDAPFVNLARWAAREVEASFARGVASGEITQATLFASPATLLATGESEPTGRHPVPAAGPSTGADVAMAAAARTFLQQRLPPLQKQIAASHGEIVYATCADRHGYLAIVTAGAAVGAIAAGSADQVPPILGRGGRLDDSDSGLLAARSRLPHCVTAPSRGLREVAVPITVEGRHWGAFRLGFAPTSDGGTRREPDARRS